jgi:diadenosine tetraphosphate (Ap4A) HIT family hydrolase
VRGPTGVRRAYRPGAVALCPAKQEGMSERPWEQGPESDWRTDRIGAARQGRNPTVLARLHSGWAVIGDFQRLPGYCVLLHDGSADHLHDLPPAQRAVFLSDMGMLGEAVAAACARVDAGFRRVNYEILGNAYGHLHAHVHPRYDWEEPGHRARPVWLYPDLYDQAHALGERHDMLRTVLTEELRTRFL